MIEFVQGDLLAADVEALVNAVNTVGVMGKGLALQFKRAYPRRTRNTGAPAERTRSSSAECMSSKSAIG